MNDEPKTNNGNLISSIIKPQEVRVLMGNFDDEISEFVSDLIKLVIKNKYDLKFLTSNCRSEILELSDRETIDIFILVINNIGSVNVVEDRLENSLQLIKQIKTKHGKPVIALCGWKKDVSIIDRAKLSADFFFLMPFTTDAFIDAIEKCLAMLPRIDSE